VVFISRAAEGWNANKLLAVVMIILHCTLCGTLIRQYATATYLERPQNYDNVFNRYMAGACDNGGGDDKCTHTFSQKTRNGDFVL
jgi:hypothetical protein